MPSLTDAKTKASPTPAIFAICLLLAASLQIIENLLPKIPVFPWLRFGLAYLVILPFLLRYGIRQTLLLFLCRNLITLMYGAQIFSSFLISTVSGIITLAIIGGIGRYLFNRQVLGLFGVSVIMALSFNLSQLTAVYFLFIQHSGFFFQVAPILIWSLVSGGVIAFLIYKGQTGLVELFAPGDDHSLLSSLPIKQRLTRWEMIHGILSLICFIAILALQHITAQLILFGLLVVATRMKPLKTVFFAWPFFMFIAWLHLFRTDGVYVIQDWITREGIQAFLFYSLRTINLIFCGQLLMRVVPGLISKWRDVPAFQGLIVAMPLLPSLFGISISLGKTFFRQIRTREFDNLLPPIIAKLKTELAAVAEQRG